MMLSEGKLAAVGLITFLHACILSVCVAWSRAARLFVGI